MAWAETALAIPNGVRHARFPEVASWATWSATARLDLPLAQEYAAQIEPAEAELGVQSAAAHEELAVRAYFGGDMEGARVHGEQAAALARRDGEAYELAMALTLLASAYDLSDDRALARQTCEDAVQAARAVGTSTLAMALIVLAQLLPDDPGRVADVLDEAFTIGVDFGDPIAIVSVLQHQAILALDQGDPALSLELALDAIERGLGAGLSSMVVMPLQVVGFALVSLGRIDQAAIVLGAARDLGHAGTPNQWTQDLAIRTESVLVEQLGRPRYDTLCRRGAELSLDQVIAVLAESVEDAP